MAARVGRVSDLPTFPSSSQEESFRRNIISRKLWTGGRCDPLFQDGTEHKGARRTFRLAGLWPVVWYSLLLCCCCCRCCCCCCCCCRYTSSQPNLQQVWADTCNTPKPMFDEKTYLSASLMPPFHDTNAHDGDVGVAAAGASQDRRRMTAPCVVRACCAAFFGIRSVSGFTTQADQPSAGTAAWQKNHARSV